MLALTTDTEDSPCHDLMQNQPPWVSVATSVLRGLLGLS